MSQSDWIRVLRGHPDDIRRAVSGFADLAGPDSPGMIHLELSRHNDGFYVVIFSTPPTPYTFTNLLGWLNAPPDIHGVSSAMGWFTAPASGERFALYPDPSNLWGDTLLGYSSQNRFIEVYQPEAAVCESSKQMRVRKEPVIESSRLSQLATIGLPLQRDSLALNPFFIVTHPKDHRWNVW